MCGGGGGGGRGGGREGALTISLGNPIKGVLFSVCLDRWGGGGAGAGVFPCKKSGKRFKYTCLERGSCLSVEKGW